MLRSSYVPDDCTKTNVGECMKERWTSECVGGEVSPSRLRRRTSSQLLGVMMRKRGDEGTGLSAWVVSAVLPVHALPKLSNTLPFVCR